MKLPPARVRLNRSSKFAPINPNGEVAVLRAGRKVDALPAEFIPLDYPGMPWRGDPAIGMSSDGDDLCRAVR